MSPAIPQLYVCDQVDCGRQFPLANGYSMVTNTAIIGDTAVAAFNYPANQQFCCSLSHMVALAKTNIDAMNQMCLDQAAQLGVTLQVDPPTA